MAELSHQCYIDGLKTIFRCNYDVQIDIVDWNSEIDFALSYEENFYILLEKFTRERLIRKGLLSIECFVKN